MIKLRIRELRELHNLSEAQLAKKANIAHSTISKIENYLESPNLVTLEKIAKVLNVKVCDLLIE